MKYWLLKSEPTTYGIDHLQEDGITAWTGVRNYQARNFMRDEMRAGDRVFFYHSSCEEPGIVGIAEICGSAYPDETQFDRKSPHHDPKASREVPRWFNIDVKFLRKTRTVSLPELRAHRELADMMILRRGNRLSITPVTAVEWACVMKLVNAK